ncbi:MAG: hypothetical protein IJ637_05230 [Prevotella sp.]|nr:hypothetical protein [Prevotella sp.]
MNRFFLSLITILLPLSVAAGTLNDIRMALEQAAMTQVQEKVYVHTDNSCYFVGDTLWYKAYVVRADNLMPTDMSRILYVELLSPDGLLVERQQIIVSGKGYTCGQFALRDSLYSGYYELRAYTRWMLNFNVGHRRYRTDDARLFFNRQMAADYYRTWDGLYSRVLPVYTKPEQPGDYDARRMYQRPKTRLPKQKKDNLAVTFYPEGGHLIEGVRNSVAFEAVDQHGEAQNIRGTVTLDNGQTLALKTDYMGRGSFAVTPGSKRLQAHFTFRGKQYDIDLPKAEQQGIALALAEGGKLTVHAKGLANDKEYALAILCRGVLQHFEALPAAGGQSPTADWQLALPQGILPTGVNDICIFDSDGQILASRLFFVNNHEQDDAVITAEINNTRTYAPYEYIEVPVQVGGVSSPTVFSLSISDTNTDEPTYNDGNLMTDLLLSSDLYGFIAHPAHYFEADDAVHRRHLDLLMMVQGWRKYKWEELANPNLNMRYTPERTMTVEGNVYKMPGIDDPEVDDVKSWLHGRGFTGERTVGDNTEDTEAATTTDADGMEEIGSTADVGDAGGYTSVTEYSDGDIASYTGGRPRQEVLVEAEIVMGNGIVGGTQKTTRHGHFMFEVPPFYGATYMNIKAYAEKDSLTKAIASRKDADAFKETAYADYYVKRNLPYPIMANQYSFYQNHAPEWQVTIDEDSLSELSMENDVHQLQNINVKGKRRGRRTADWTKPAYVCDAYDLYNDVTDYGLSFGHFNRGLFPAQAAHFLYGNMGRYRSFHIDGRLEKQTYWRNYNSGSTQMERDSKDIDNRSPAYIFDRLALSRLQYVKFYSDYEPRMPDSTMVEEVYSADATVEMVPMANDAKQLVYRDRHIFLRGFNAAEQFYQPDYSNMQLGKRPADYRRTLYWNPNAVTDSEGRFTATFYNNGKDTRIKFTAAGISGDGKLLHSARGY